MMTGEQFSQHGFFDSVKNNDSCSKYIVFKELISAMKKRLDFLTSKILFLDYTAKYHYRAKMQNSIRMEARLANLVSCVA